MAETLAIRWGSVQAGRAVIDCDLHNVVPSAQALFPWLSDYWREYITQSGFKGPNDTRLSQGAHLGAAGDDAGRRAARLRPRAACGRRRSTPGAPRSAS